MSASFLAVEATRTLAVSYTTEPSVDHELLLERLTSDMLLATVGQERAIPRAQAHIAGCPETVQCDLVYASAHAILASLSLVYRGDRFSSLLDRVNLIRDQILGRDTRRATSPADGGAARKIAA